MFTVELTTKSGWEVDQSPKRAATHWVNARIVKTDHPELVGLARVKIRVIEDDFAFGLPELKPGKKFAISTRAPAVRAKGGGVYFFLVPRFTGARRPQTAILTGTN